MGATRTFENVYFLGIGGIGMSALARYFLHDGKRVAGYDRTRTPLTEQLEHEGAQIHYTEDVDAIPQAFRDPAKTVVVYTPAVPGDHAELRYFETHGFEIEKRSRMLGHLSEGRFVMAVAGTHGKTSTTTLIAWLNHVVTGTGSAFLGGVSRNFGSNLVPDGGARCGPKAQRDSCAVSQSLATQDSRAPRPRLAVEADEFDRSFLTLHPDVAIITSTDADHLDIYETHDALRNAFAQFARQIKPGGSLILKHGIGMTLPDVEVYRYSYDTPCDFYAIPAATGSFDLVTPDGVIRDCRVGVPGWVNVENAVAAVAALWCASKRDGLPFDTERVREGLATFEGVKRRFEFYINTPERVYMDDYAHHPAELRAAITSLRNIFPGRHLTAIFQPHLYTRTRDFYREFAASLSLADEVILLPIYPARELPIEGVTSEMIGEELTVPWSIVPRGAIVDILRSRATRDIVATFGAGDIDTCCQKIYEALK